MWREFRQTLRHQSWVFLILLVIVATGALGIAWGLAQVLLYVLAWAAVDR